MQEQSSRLFQYLARSTALFITLLTVQGLSEMLSPAFLCQDPRPIRHRGLVTHVLTMAALKISHPIAIFIEVISNNGLMHPRTFLRSLLWTRGMLDSRAC